MSEDAMEKSRRTMADLLREQGEDDESIQALMPALNRLMHWPAPEPTHQDTVMLIEQLIPLLPLPRNSAIAGKSNARKAMDDQRPYTKPADNLSQFLRVAVAQVGLLRPTFWLVSAAIVAFGALILLSWPSSQQAS